MKKSLSILAFICSVLAISFAGTMATPTTESGSVVIREGRNTVRLRNGILLFMARGGEISGVELRQPTGQLIKFEDEGCTTCGSQPPKPCTGETRCVYSEKYKAKICFCLPKLGLSNGGGGTEASDFLIVIEDIKGESK